MKALEKTWKENETGLEDRQEDGRREWIDRQIKGLSVLLVLSQLFYFAGKGVWMQIERMWNIRIFVGVLTLDSILLIFLLGLSGARFLLARREEGMFFRGVLVCFLLLLIFGILSFLLNLLLF